MRKMKCFFSFTSYIIGTKKKMLMKDFVLLMFMDTYFGCFMEGEPGCCFNPS